MSCVTRDSFKYGRAFCRQAVKLILRPALLLLRLGPALDSIQGQLRPHGGLHALPVCPPVSALGGANSPGAHGIYASAAPSCLGAPGPLGCWSAGLLPARPGSCLQSGSRGPSLRKHSSARSPCPDSIRSHSPQLSALSLWPTPHGAHLPAPCPPSSAMRPTWRVSPSELRLFGTSSRPARLFPPALNEQEQCLPEIVEMKQEVTSILSFSAMT